MARILVVDDEADVRSLVRVTLELDGHEVAEAADGLAALRLLDEAGPGAVDAMVLDVMMPGMDGWEVLTRVKAGADPVLADLPVVMLTARRGDLDRIRGGIEGAVLYLTKPFDPQALSEQVRLVLAGGPEPEQRRRAQHGALAQLARLEAGTTAGPDGLDPPARPRLTRLGTSVEAGPARRRPRRLAAAQVRLLSPAQQELLAAVGGAPTVLAAARQLGVSRSNVYASLRRIARRLGVATVPELLALARLGVPDDAP